MNYWSDEQDAYLRELCASGEQYSVSQLARLISAKFGIEPPLPRASVMGRARRRRIRLPGYRKPRPAPAVMAPPPPPLSATTQVRPKARPEPDPRLRRRLAILPELPRATGVFLLNASDTDCRWPINDPPRGRRELLRVCGAPVTPGERYCADCRKRAYAAEPAEPGGFFVLPSKQRGLK